MAIWFLVFVALIMAIGGVYWFTRAESNDYFETKRAIADLHGDIGKLKLDFTDIAGAISLIQSKLDSIADAQSKRNECQENVNIEQMKSINGMKTDIDILKQRMKHLNGKLIDAARPMAVSFSSALPVEIIKKPSPKKPLLERAGVKSKSKPKAH